MEIGKRVTLERTMVLKALLPIGTFFAIGLVLSNAAYHDLSIAFMQMMKMSNVVVVYMLSVLVKLERWITQRIGMLLLIILATCLTIQGEVHFSTRGFALQVSSQILGCSTLVLSGMLLSKGQGTKLDVFSYNLLVSPISFMMLLIVLVGSAMIPIFSIPTWTHVASWWPLLLINATIVYVMNICVAMLVKYTSPVGLCLAGLLKDATVVFAGVVALGEDITRLQSIGFLGQLVLIYLYTSQKMEGEATTKEKFGGIEEEPNLPKEASYGTTLPRP